MYLSNEADRMADLVFVPMDESELRTLESWLDDPELRRRYCRPTHTWFDYVRHDPGVYAWMIHEDGFLAFFLDRLRGFELSCAHRSR